MKGIDKFSLAAGIVFVVGGIALLILGLFIWVTLIHGTVLLIIGIIILVTLRQQEHIEPIRLKKKKSIK